MDFYESYTHAFILKIWLEEFPEENGKVVWSGYITHVPSNRLRYVRSWFEILDVIGKHARQMGVRMPIWWRLRQQLLRSRRKEKEADEESQEKTVPP